MDEWSSWLKDNPPVAIVALVFGSAVVISALGMVVGLLITLAGISPPLGFAALFTLVALGYGGLRYSPNGSDSDESAVDPVTELEGRYVRGELSDDEFEHRLDTLIETEAEIDRAAETDHTTRSREVDTEMG